MYISSNSRTDITFFVTKSPIICPKKLLAVMFLEIGDISYLARDKKCFLSLVYTELADISYLVNKTKREEIS